jgi:hypothetical protein
VVAVAAITLHNSIRNLRDCYLKHPRTTPLQWPVRKAVVIQFACFRDFRNDFPRPLSYLETSDVIKTIAFSRLPKHRSPESLLNRKFKNCSSLKNSMDDFMKAFERTNSIVAVPRKEPPGHLWMTDLTPAHIHSLRIQTITDTPLCEIIPEEYIPSDQDPRTLSPNLEYW